MQKAIGENIRRLRKERGFTQEQLAEALGLSVGAVSKWERDAAEPDAGKLMELAALFDVSVDVILGFRLREGGPAGAAERILNLMKQRELDESIREAERALQKYPNSFDVVYRSAKAYSNAGIVRGAEGSGDRELRRALELLRQALVLYPQSDGKVGEVSICKDIALIYICLGDRERALEELKKTNYDDQNSDMIGFFLAPCKGKEREALDYLSAALERSFSALLRTGLGYMNAYCGAGRYRDGAEAAEWCLGLLRSLRRPGTEGSYADKGEVMLLSGLAVCNMLEGKREKAREALCLGRDIGRRFDADPHYDMCWLRFYERETRSVAYDDFGETALSGLENVLRENDAYCGGELWRLWEEVRDEN